MKALFGDAERVWVRWKSVVRRWHSNYNPDTVFDLVSESATQAGHPELAAAKHQSCLLVVSWTVSPD